MKPGTPNPDRPWLDVAKGLLLFKGIYAGILLLALQIYPGFEDSTAGYIREYWFPKEGAIWLEGQQSGFRRHFTTWDATHFLYLSQFGYTPDLKSAAMYPLWPTLMSMAARVTGIDAVWVGLLLANGFSLAAWILFYRTTRDGWGPEVAHLALMLLVLFPGTLFQQFNYSESVFFFLLMWVWRGIRQGRFGIASLAGFFLPMTRAVGLLALLPAAWDVIRRWRGAAPENRLRSAMGPMVLGGVILTGWGTYLLLMKEWTGDAFSGFAAQAHWKAHSIENLLHPERAVSAFFNPTSWHSFRGSLLDRVGFALFLLLLPSVWRRGKDLFCWVVILGLVPALSGLFVSFIRFEGIVFPLFIVAACELRGPGRRGRRMIVPILVFLGALHAVLAWRFVSYQWAG